MCNTFLHDVHRITVISLQGVAHFLQDELLQLTLIIQPVSGWWPDRRGKSSSNSSNETEGEVERVGQYMQNCVHYSGRSTSGFTHLSVTTKCRFFGFNAIFYHVLHKKNRGG